VNKDLVTVHACVSLGVKELLLTVAHGRRTTLSAVIRRACEDFVQLHRPKTVNPDALSTGQMRVLHAMAKIGRPVNVKDLSRHLDVSKGRIYKHVRKLMEKGRIHKAIGQYGKYVVAVEEIGPERQ